MTIGTWVYASQSKKLTTSIFSHSLLALPRGFSHRCSHESPLLKAASDLISLLPEPIIILQISKGRTFLPPPSNFSFLPWNWCQSHFKQQSEHSTFCLKTRNCPESPYYLQVIHTPLSFLSLSTRLSSLVFHYSKSSYVTSSLCPGLFLSLLLCSHCFPAWNAASPHSTFFFLTSLLEYNCFTMVC